MDKYKMLFKHNNRIIDLVGTALMIKRFPILIKDQKFLKENKNLPSKKKHDTCYILGTGPSLKSIDLAKIDGDTFATNMFYRYEDALKLNPNFYILVDEKFYIGKTIEVVPEIMERYPKANFLFNGLYRKQVEPLLPRDLVCNYVYLWNGSMNPRKTIDCSRVLPAMNNVVNIAICVAIYMNYKNIILLGCDFSSFAATKKVHCYAEAKEERNMTMAYELFNYSLVAEAHLSLAEYARERGINILNATQGSLIDAYERISSKHLEK
jgi:hypothetical protein